MDRFFAWLATAAAIFFVIGGLVTASLGGSLSGEITAAGPKIADGMVTGLQPGTTLYLMNNALLERLGFHILENAAYPGSYFWIGPIANDGVGFAMNNATPESVQALIKCGGNLANCSTVVKLLQWARNNGWQVIPASRVPSTIKLAIESAIASRVAASALTESAFVFAPLHAFTDDSPMSKLEVLEYYSTWNNVWH